MVVVLSPLWQEAEETATPLRKMKLVWNDPAGLAGDDKVTRLLGDGLGEWAREGLREAWDGIFSWLGRAIGVHVTCRMHMCMSTDHKR